MINLKIGGIIVAAFIAGTFIASPELRAYAANTVFSSDIVDGEVKSVDIGDGEVTSQDLASSAVTNSKIATDAISTSKIAPGAVTNSDIGGSAVTTGKIKDGQVMAADIAPDAVSNSKLASNSVTLSKIAPNSINTTQILDGAVTPAKLVPNGRITYTDYVGYVFTPTPTYHVATGVAYPIEAGLWKKVRFFIWQGGASADNKITLELWAGSIGLTTNPNNSAYFQTTNVGVDPSTSDAFTMLASIKIKKVNEYLLSPWITIPSTANILSLNIIGDGVATFQPQEQGYELTQESFPEGWR